MRRHAISHAARHAALTPRRDFERAAPRAAFICAITRRRRRQHAAALPPPPSSADLLSPRRAMRALRSRAPPCAAVALFSLLQACLIRRCRAFAFHYAAFAIMPFDDASNRCALPLRRHCRRAAFALLPARHAGYADIAPPRRPPSDAA